MSLDDPISDDLYPFRRAVLEQALAEQVEWPEWPDEVDHDLLLLKLFSLVMELYGKKETMDIRPELRRILLAALKWLENEEERRAALRQDDGIEAVQR